MSIKSAFKKKSALFLNVRKKIYCFVEKYPGIHFRELQRKTKLAIGNLGYHLKYLEKLDLIKGERLLGKKLFYPAGLNDYERKILGILKQKNFRKIIIKLLNKNQNHRYFVKYLNLSPSTVTWYLVSLDDIGILVVQKKGREKFYQLKNKQEIIKIIITYKESFLDKLVDRFVDTWEE